MAISMQSSHGQLQVNMGKYMNTNFLCDVGGTGFFSFNLFIQSISFLWLIQPMGVGENVLV